MAIIDGLLNELKHESAGTRKTLERVPDAKFAWKPHAKSMSMIALASHLCEIPGWGASTLLDESFDIPAGYKPWLAASNKELVATFDKNNAALLKAMEGYPDAKLMTPWTLSMAGKPIFTLPRIAVMRNMIMNHAVHHRAQLGVYLRLNDIAVPSIYGPSADEQPAPK